MINNNTLSALAGILLVITSLSSQATIINGWGAYAATSTNDNCPSYCDGNSEYDSSGGEGSIFATAEQNSYGTAKALVDMSGSGYLPTLKVKASATAGKYAGATAFSSQGFNYSGQNDTSITLDINLHGSVGGNSSSNSLTAHIGIIIGTDFNFYPHFGTAYYECFCGRPSGLEYLNISSGNDINKAGSISFDLQAGESFFVISEMNASSRNGFVDAWNTLTLGFQDSTGLHAVGGAPTGNTIPEPSSIILVLMALTFLVRRQMTL